MPTCGECGARYEGKQCPICTITESTSRAADQVSDAVREAAFQSTLAALKAAATVRKAVAEQAARVQSALEAQTLAIRDALARADVLQANEKIRQAIDLLARDLVDEAARLLERAIELHPSSFSGQYYALVCRLRRGPVERLTEQLKKLFTIASLPDNRGQPLWLAQVWELLATLKKESLISASDFTQLKAFGTDCTFQICEKEADAWIRSGETASLLRAIAGAESSFRSALRLFEQIVAAVDSDTVERHWKSFLDLASYCRIVLAAQNDEKAEVTRRLETLLDEKLGFLKTHCPQTLYHLFLLQIEASSARLQLRRWLESMFPKRREEVLSEYLALKSEVPYQLNGITKKEFEQAILLAYRQHAAEIRAELLSFADSIVASDRSFSNVGCGCLTTILSFGLAIAIESFFNTAVALIFLAVAMLAIWVVSPIILMLEKRQERRHRFAQLLAQEATKWKPIFGTEDAVLSVLEKESRLGGDLGSPGLRPEQDITESPPSGLKALKQPVFWLVSLVAILVIAFLAYFTGGLRERKAKFFRGETTSRSFVDELDGSTIGEAHGITFSKGLLGEAAVFTRERSSRIVYPQIPPEGTLEMWLRVDEGYRYDNYALRVSQPCALVFTTDCDGGDVSYPGSTWLKVCSNGDILLTMATAKYGKAPAQEAVARGTGFRFGEWHALGVSFGDEGQYIMLDGVLLASEPMHSQRLGAGGNHSKPLDRPTIGEAPCGFWGERQYSGGFIGAVDRFRASSRQRDWVLAAGKPSRGGLR
jgi:hypothetical protein